MSAASTDRGSIRHALVDPIRPALVVGAASGVIGAIGGGLAGLISSNNPRLFATAAGFQCLGLGSAFWYTRNLGLPASASENMTSRESVLRSSVAGGIAGAVNGASRSRSNIFPGALMVGLIGMLGQCAYNRFRAGPDRLENQTPYGQRLLDSRWMPLKRLSDEEYIGMLNEKTIRVDAEIALIDEKIAAIQKNRHGAHQDQVNRQAETGKG